MDELPGAMSRVLPGPHKTGKGDEVSEWMNERMNGWITRSYEPRPSWSRSTQDRPGWWSAPRRCWHPETSGYTYNTNMSVLRYDHERTYKETGLVWMIIDHFL